MSASSALPGLEIMPVDFVVETTFEVAMMKVELYRNSGQKP